MKVQNENKRLFKRKKAETSMLEGPIIKGIIAIALPTLCMNLIQIFYNTADKIIAGYSGEPDAIGAVGSIGSICQLIINIILAFAVVTNIMVARHLGAKDEEQASKAIHTTLVLSFIMGTVVMVIGIAIANPLLTIIGYSGRFFELAKNYMVCYFFGAPFIALTNTLISVFKANGKTKIPFYILTASGLINVLLNLFFVFVCGLSTEGVAIATAIANALSAIAMLIVLSKEKGACKVSFAKMRIDKDEAKDYFSMGVPYAIQNSVTVFSDMVSQSTLLNLNNSLTPANATFQPVIKANSAVGGLNGFLFQGYNVFAQTGMSFISQNLGAKNIKRVRKVRTSTVLIAVIVAIIIGSTMFFARTPLLSLFGVVPGADGSVDKIAFDTATISMVYSGIMSFLLAFNTATLSLLRGIGKSFEPMLITILCTTLFSILWNLFIFPLNPTTHMFFIRGPISATLSGVIGYIYLRVSLKRIENSIKVE